MDKIYFYSIYDHKTSNYDTPWCMMNDMHAKRKFTVMILNEKSILTHFKNDFELRRVGSFNVVTGKLESEIVTIADGKQIEPNNNQGG
jgi:hypothetical protein